MQMSEPSRKTVLKLLVDSLKAAGRLFQMAATETAKSLVPMTVLVPHTNSFMVSADRRCHRQAGCSHRLGTTGRVLEDTQRRSWRV